MVLARGGVDVPLHDMFSRYDRNGCAFLVAGGASIEGFRRSCRVMHGTADSDTRNLLALDEHLPTGQWVPGNLDDEHERVRRVDIKASARSAAATAAATAEGDDTSVAESETKSDCVVTSPTSLQRVLIEQIEEMESDMLGGFHSSQLRVSIHSIDSLISTTRPEDVASTLSVLQDEVTARDGRLYVHFPLGRDDDAVQRMWQLLKADFNACLNVELDTESDTLFHTYEIPTLGEYGPIEVGAE